MAWNQRYPIEPADEAEKPKYQVGSAAELGALLEALRQNADSKAYEHPVPFPWGHTDSLGRTLWSPDTPAHLSKL
jgi:hypothetical protein